MDADRGPQLIWGVTMALLLVGSLMARRQNWRQTTKYALAWILIFAIAYGLFLFRADFAAIWHRARADLTGTSADSGGNIILIRDDRGHFTLHATVNGAPVTFLVDSGASITAVNFATARAIGFTNPTARAPLVVETANGLANSYPLGDVDIVVGGARVAGVAVETGEQLGDNLLGMNFLNKLQRWSVEGDRMILTL
ncbi:MAG: TIGR02281 family clan AA aspartic protease [Sphingomonadaceae bacterium]|nr:TIGR02281 family clan AA aspartic protease [Sphingomonadaceae bacterium]